MTDDFAAIRYPTFAPSPCSPVIPKGEFGLRIRCPERASFAAARSAAIPVCGTVRLTSAQLHGVGDPIEDVVIVFLNRASGVPTTLSLRPEKEAEPPPNELPSDVIPFSALPPGIPMEEAIADYHFNVDALMFCPDFPRAPAHYFVHALLGPWVSNVVEVEVEDT